MFDVLLHGDYGLAPTNLSYLALGVLLAFLSGQAIAWVYMFTHNGVSYSRSFVVSLILMPVIVAVVMTVLANSLVTAFGMMAVFAVVRFRNILRDTLDTAYVLAVLVLGMACGMAKFTTAVMGCAAICMILVYLWLTGFGTRHRFDLILNLSWLRPGTRAHGVESITGAPLSQGHLRQPQADGGRGRHGLLLSTPDA